MAHQNTHSNVNSTTKTSLSLLLIGYLTAVLFLFKSIQKHNGGIDLLFQLCTKVRVNLTFSRSLRAPVETGPRVIGLIIGAHYKLVNFSRDDNKRRFIHRNRRPSIRA